MPERRFEKKKGNLMGKGGGGNCNLKDLEKIEVD